MMAFRLLTRYLVLTRTAPTRTLGRDDDVQLSLLAVFNSTLTASRLQKVPVSLMLLLSSEFEVQLVCLLLPGQIHLLHVPVML